VKKSRNTVLIHQQQQRQQKRKQQQALGADRNICAAEHSAAAMRVKEGIGEETV
jgi:hypothetical protein